MTTDLTRAAVGQLCDRLQRNELLPGALVLVAAAQLVASADGRVLHQSGWPAMRFAAAGTRDGAGLRRLVLEHLGNPALAPLAARLSEPAIGARFTMAAAHAGGEMVVELAVGAVVAFAVGRLVGITTPDGLALAAAFCAAAEPLGPRTMELRALIGWLSELRHDQATRLVEDFAARPEGMQLVRRTLLSSAVLAARLNGDQPRAQALTRDLADERALSSDAKRLVTARLAELALDAAGERAWTAAVSALPATLWAGQPRERRLLLLESVGRAALGIVALGLTPAAETLLGPLRHGDLPPLLNTALTATARPT